jgi:lysophospholipase L1-like esterase
MVAIGDSTTAGTPYFRSPLEVPLKGQGDPEGQYCYWMMRKKKNWNVLNHGIAGETSSQILSRFEHAVRLGPRFIIILAGVNDIYQDTPPERITENLLLMYKQAKAHGIMPVAVTVPPFDKATTEQAEALDKLNKWILKEAEVLRIPVADAAKALANPDNPHALTGSPDGLHPDVGGYRTIGMKIIEAIEPLENAWR